jgi:hypothetical protein
MISRQFRAFNNGNTPVNFRCLLGNEEVRTLTEYERKCVELMENTYRKLLDDDIYLDGLELMETRIQSIKIELCHLTNQKHELIKVCNRLRVGLMNGNVIIGDENQRILYFHERHEEVAIRCRVLLDKCKALSCRMVGMCYWPLIDAMRCVMNHHGKVCDKETCQLKSGSDFILSHILLLILRNCDLEVFPVMTKCVSRWNLGNICAHPIIKMMESKIDDQMYYHRNISTQTPVEVVRNISVDMFETYEVLYLEWVVINMISTYLKYNHRYAMNLKIILSINGIGMLIYGFLITEARVLSLLAKVRYSKKRKFD